MFISIQTVKRVFPLHALCSHINTGFAMLFMIADFQPVAQNVNMKQRLADTGPTHPNHVKGGMSCKSTAWQMHNIQIYRIMTNLLNLHETYKTQNKAVELGKLHCVWCCVWDFVHWACTSSAYVTVNSAVPSSWYSAIGLWSLIASCIVCEFCKIFHKFQISSVWSLQNVSPKMRFSCRAQV